MPVTAAPLLRNFVACRFSLHRHWTLFESMVHSPYVAPRMQTWGEAGRKAIRHLMAKMGVPKTEFEEVPFREWPRRLLALGIAVVQWCLITSSLRLGIIATLSYCLMQLTCLSVCWTRLSRQGWVQRPRQPVHAPTLLHQSVAPPFNTRIACVFHRPLAAPHMR